MGVTEILSKTELNEAEKAEFFAYIENRYKDRVENPFPDTDFLRLWEEITDYAEKNGAAAAINSMVCPKRPVEFKAPDLLEIKMYDSFAGRIPIIYARNTDDFEQLVTNIAHKGIRPENLSQTGASFLFGKSTRFIILSAKPYSNVPADEIGLEKDLWAEKSMLLRREHECTHYYTRQIYEISNNILHDEIMADFNGLYEAFGFYKAEWFLRFMGVIEGSGGRLIYYTEDLSPKVRDAVSKLLEEAAYKLEKWSETEEFRSLSIGERIKVMCKAGLDGISTWEY